MPYLRKAVDAPFGFMPHGPVLSVRGYYKDASAGAIYPGDAVILETDGGIDQAATSSANIIGVAAEYSAASTEKVGFLVYDHPDQEYVVQDDSDTTPLTRAEEGENCNITVTDGNTTTLRSQHELDSDTGDTTSSLAVKIIKLHPCEEASYASAAGSPRRWIVKFNSHLWGGAEQTGI
jgi:hypothetical protein